MIGDDAKVVCFHGHEKREDSFPVVNEARRRGDDWYVPGASAAAPCRACFSYDQIHT